MADAPADSRYALDAMIDAFASGDNARGEILLSSALDQGVAWDRVTMAAAEALARCRTNRRLLATSLEGPRAPLPGTQIDVPETITTPQM